MVVYHLITINDEEQNKINVEMVYNGRDCDRKN
jgi:hypothetical protein